MIIFTEFQHAIFIQQEYSFNSKAKYLTCKKNICSTSITKEMFCGMNIFIQCQHKSFSFKFIKKYLFTLSQVLGYQ